MKHFLSCALATLLAIAPSAYAASSGDAMIRHTTVVDVEHIRTMADQAVVLHDEGIVAIGPGNDIAKARGKPSSR